MFFIFLTGCPTDYSLMGVLQEFNGTGQILHADFDAFKFPTSSVVQFRALVNYSQEFKIVLDYSTFSFI
jgi:hypothetical protein